MINAAAEPRVKHGAKYLACGFTAGSIWRFYGSTELAEVRRFGS